MSDSVWKQLVETLSDVGLTFEPGLTDDEFERVEGRFGFRFPPDLREFLRAGLPVGKQFPNWRDDSGETLKRRLDVPLEGVLFDVEQNGFWLDEWGSRPASLDDAKAAVRRFVSEAPVLIPIFIHRMIPDRPHLAGNPVFSVHQTDIIYYGVDLRDYLIHEFLADKNVGIWPIPDAIRMIEFWEIKRFQSVRWSAGAVAFDSRDGVLPRRTIRP